MMNKFGWFTVKIYAELPYFIECVSAFDFEFGGRVGINPEAGRQEIIGPGSCNEMGKRTNQAMSFTGVPLTFVL